LQDYLQQEELKLKERIVFENDHVALVPFKYLAL
jgi:galactose-1-phosphate uridylyltransferase